jgi:hypothetical protein
MKKTDQHLSTGNKTQNKTQNMKPSMKKSLFLSVLAVISLGGLASSHAAIITWGSAQNITGDSDVLTTGTFDRAYSFQVSQTNGDSDLLVNGVTFTSISTPTSPGISNLTLDNTTIASTTTFASLNDNFNSMTGDYNTLVLNAFYALAGQLNLTFNGLTNGQDYRVQLWVSYMPGGGKTETISSGNSASISSFGGGSGQFVVGNFTANSSSQVFNVSSGDTYPLLNAVSLYAVPEPSTYALVLGGILTLLLIRRRVQA